MGISIVATILKPLIIFTLVASFSMFFMSLFIVAGILTTKINRNVVERQDEIKNFKNYIVVSLSSLVSGGIALIAMTFV